MTPEAFAAVYETALLARADSDDEEVRALTDRDIYEALRRRFGVKPKRAYLDPTADMALWRYEASQ